MIRTKIIFPFFIVFFYAVFSSSAQAILVKGKVVNSINNTPIPLAIITVQGMPITTQTDSSGNYSLMVEKDGVYSFEIRRVGFKSTLIPEVSILTGKSNILDVLLDNDPTQLGEIKVTAPLSTKTVESPVSLRVIGITEIKRNPGGNRDISKALQSLPGVATSTGFRNDIIVRGGAPNENRFYLDGIEIPNINHFATQGSSGGPVGLLNVDFIREVDFFSGAFPANRGNALSSILEFKQKDGRMDKQAGALTLGSSDLALTGEGPLSDKTSYLGSIRQSYLQFLFKLLSLSFLPTYNDFQFKIKSRFNSKNELTLLGLGALDRFQLNTSASTTELQQYELATIPVQNQNNYTFGLNFKNYAKSGYTTLVLSRNYLENKITKFENNDPNSIQLIRYQSKEIENKLRVENTLQSGNYRINEGINIETGQSNSQNFRLLPSGTVNYFSTLQFLKYGIFGQISRSYLNEKLAFSAGLRTDGNTFTSQGNNLLRQLSPRISLSYDFGNGFSINANSGLYFQLPTYTLLSFRDSSSKLTNMAARYISNWESVLGLEYINYSNVKFSVEGFYKRYQHYPFVKVLGDTISLANFGSDFGVVGDNRQVGDGMGRSYGIEFLIQQRVKKGFYGIGTLTLVRSEFENNHQEYIPSSWDSKIFMAFTGGKIFRKGWEFGAKLRLSGGAPYTPYDINRSSLITNYSIYPQGIPNYAQTNTHRLSLFYQLDARIDKKIRGKKVNFDFFLDIQNLTNKVYSLPPYLILDSDAKGNPQTLSGDISRYKTKFLDNQSGNLLPSLGVILELTR